MDELLSNRPFCSNNLMMSSECKNSGWLIYLRLANSRSQIQRNISKKIVVGSSKGWTFISYIFYEKDNFISLSIFNLIYSNVEILLKPHKKSLEKSLKTSHRVLGLLCMYRKLFRSSAWKNKRGKWKWSFSIMLRFYYCVL